MGAIRDLFDAADLTPSDVPLAQLPTGERRSLVERYFAAVDWTSPQSVARVVRAFEEVLRQIDEPVERQALLAPLVRDGFDYHQGRLRQRRSTGLAGIASASNLIDAAVLHDHIERIESGLETDPAQAIGSAKELVESVAKLVLVVYGQDASGLDSVQQLVKAALKSLNPGLEELPRSREGSSAIRQVVSGLAQVVGGTAELRNLYGTGHGREVRMALEPRHARLVVGAAGTLCWYLLQTLDARKNAPAIEAPISS